MSDEKKIVSASPKVRKLAREFGADIYQIQGSQREGRVSEEDVKSFVKESISGKVEKKHDPTSLQYEHSEFGEVEIKPIPRLKKIAGPHLEKSWSEIPHVTQHDEADITEMEKFRKSLRDLYTGEKLSITPLPFIIRAVVKALKDYPNFNSSLDPKKEKLIYKKYFHIGIAMDTPHGLMVPKIRDADKKDITELGKEIKKISGNEKNTTNNRMELLAPINALKDMKPGIEIKIYTDSQYVKNGITEWINTWLANNWKTSKKEDVKNKDLWIELYNLNKSLNVQWNWVKAHDGNPMNEEVDLLAKKAANLD